MIYPCETEVGELCYCRIGNDGHPVCSEPVRSLFSVRALSAHYGRTLRPSKDCAFDVDCLLPDKKEERFANLICTESVRVSFI